MRKNESARMHLYRKKGDSYGNQLLQVMEANN